MVNISIVSSARRRSSAALKIIGNREVEMQVPKKSPISRIIDFVVASVRFLEKSLTVQGRVVQKKVIKDGDTIFIFGQEYCAQLTKAKRTKVQLRTDDFVIYTKNAEIQSRVVAITSKSGTFISIQDFYKLIKSELFTIVEQYTNEICQAMNTGTYNKLRVKQVRSIWGSCSRTRNLTFSVRLIHYPLEIIKYVVIHEVAHLLHPNHSKMFWNLVKQFSPDYKVLRRDMKKSRFG